MKKDWKTTLTGVISALLVIAGMFIPDKFDPETQAAINIGLGQVITGIGAIVAVVSGWKAKDPE